MTAVNLKERRARATSPTMPSRDGGAGRPALPHMCLENVIHLGVSTVEACVEVDDTRPG